MKRLHVHVAVDDLEKSKAFYATMFGAEPTVLKDDDAKWMLDDPRVNSRFPRMAEPEASITWASRPTPARRLPRSLDVSRRRGRPPSISQRRPAATPGRTRHG